MLAMLLGFGFELCFFGGFDAIIYVGGILVRYLLTRM